MSETGDYYRREASNLLAENTCSEYMQKVCLLDRQMDRHTDGQTDNRQTDRQTGRQTRTDRQTNKDRQTDRQTNTDRWTDRQTNKDRQTDRQTNTDRWTDRQIQTDGQTDWQTDRHKSDIINMLLYLLAGLCKTTRRATSCEKVPSPQLICKGIQYTSPLTQPPHTYNSNLSRRSLVRRKLDWLRISLTSYKENVALWSKTRRKKVGVY